ncbi:DSD1 family PLP-dependent enzyme [Mycobacteroides abscessus]|uniref:DSD1 family PLP-dependent enzyme n=1 Tax=Mycobacteroides abscessus TaxID=36809 RepID=UPI00031D0CC4|nr:DSD1 family PLP-dependent enzyme [Mycobacteroides abscessus]
MQQALTVVGRPGSRHRIPTPAALIDFAALRHNVVSAAQACASAGVALRPHAKTHKSADLARIQLEAGAVGICTAKVGEAEALFGAGIRDILVTSPVVTDTVAARVAGLAAANAGVIATLDHLDGVAALAAAAAASFAHIDVLIDVDVGLHRTGVPSPEHAVELAEAIRKSARLRLRGVQGYGGHWQHIKDFAERRAAVAEGMQILSTVVESLNAQGHETGIRSGGGTGTLEIDLALGVLNEVQPGSYVVMDRQYEDVQGPLLKSFEQALFIASTVTGTYQAGFATVDAGLKAFATDAELPGSTRGEYFWYGDEQGMLVSATDHPVLGTQVEFVPPHCDPTIDRYDVLHIVEGDELVELWPIQARGRSQ